MIYRFQKSFSALLFIIYAAAFISNSIPVNFFKNYGIPLTSVVCSGNCDLDGCLPENRKNHTCCCWQSKTDETKNNSEHCKLDHQIFQSDDDQVQAQLIIIDDEYFDIDGNRVNKMLKCGSPCSKNNILLTLLNNFSEPVVFEIYSTEIAINSDDINYKRTSLSFTPSFSKPPIPPPKIVS